MRRRGPRALGVAGAACLAAVMLSGCASSPGGTIVFGSRIAKASADVSIQGPASSFSRGAKLAFIAYLPGQTGDTTLTVTESRHSGALSGPDSSQKIKRPNTSDNVIAATLDTSGLGAGRYTMRISSGTTSLAQGNFQITG